MAAIRRLHAKVNGIVQGVGFRPFVYRLAKTLDLSGWVRNEPAGVFIEVEGTSEKIEIFFDKLLVNSPPLAQIEELSITETAVCGETDFFIQDTARCSAIQTLMSPDVAICEECLREMFDPGDRRFRYPFINCTNCGPRYTIIRALPYDRSQTTMSEFLMCAECSVEYNNPKDRRFHAEPNACHKCGPKVTLVDNRGYLQPGDPIDEAVKLLINGAVVAVKGLGGFHLVCNAVDEEAVNRLRIKKGRARKPLAIMSRSLEEIEKFCYLEAPEIQLLKSNQRPIVLLKKKGVEGIIAPSVAPGSNYLGVMLPYTPLHYLLLEDIPGGLVMTSGNPSSEPIIFQNEEAIQKLGDKTDFFLVHNRAIHQRCDDSVVQSFRGREMVIRRARGYSPAPLKLPFAVNEILACGAELKNTFCLTKGNYAFISHHIGDLNNPESLASFEEAVRHLQKVFGIKPGLVAHDLHPDYLSTRYALKKAGAVHCGVQHHHAHIASCMAENGVLGRVIGLSFDGTGYGTDGNIWGGEFLVCDYKDFVRAAHLRYVPLVSGDQAVREPWRMAAVYLKLVFGDAFLRMPVPFTNGIDRDVWRLLDISMARGINAPFTSSMGRLFDAVSALLGICSKIRYEGQAAYELEQSAEPEARGVYRYYLTQEPGQSIIVDTLPIIKDIAGDIIAGEDTGVIAGRFHNTVADLAVQTCLTLREQNGINQVALSGGVFQNILLLTKIEAGLTKHGFRVYTHSKVPTNDGGICLGQAVIAGERSKINVFGDTGKNN